MFVRPAEGCETGLENSDEQGVERLEFFEFLAVPESAPPE